MPDMFSLELPDPNNMTKEQADALNEFMDAIFASYEAETKNIANSLGVSEKCASDIFYLRTRSRWTQELEAELIQFHKNNVPVNIFDFGHN